MPLTQISGYVIVLCVGKLWNLLTISIRCELVIALQTRLANKTQARKVIS